METNNRKQLVTQDNGSIEKIFPKNYMSNIVDEETGESLRIFLLKYNHIDLGYRSSKSSARLAVPIIMRRKGLYITYYLPDDIVITEFFNGNKTEVSDTNWIKDELWVKDVNELNVYDVKISDGSITLDKLSEEVMQLISSKGDITINNFPDNEDLELYTIYQDSNNKIDAIRFKDRDNSNGMAYKYLRKTKNMILSQSDFNQANTIYEIRYDFDLNGNTINIPDSCELKFVGGSLKNGYLKGSLLNSVIDFSRIKVDDLGVFFSYFKLKDNQTVIFEKDKVYTSSIDININASNITINGNGATIQSVNTEHLSNIIEISPKVAIYYGLSIETTINSNIVSLGTIASDIQIGDYIQLRDSANRLNLGYHNGIYAIVLDKNGNDITLDVPYNSNIITYIEVYKPLDNIKIFDLILGFNSSHGQRGIRLVKCRNSEIYNIKADGLGNLAGIYIDDCYYTKVHDCVLSKFFDIDRIVNMNGYGIGASGRNIEIYNNNVYDCRHCYAGDSRDYVSFIHIHDNTASYSYNTYTELNGIQSVIYAGMYDLHGNNKGIIENNIGTTTLLESGKWYGITVRESDVIIRNNIIENNSNTFEGLAIILSELAYDNILIENNKITGRVVIGSAITNLQLINNIFNDSFIDFSTISDNTKKSVDILYNKFYINNVARTTPIIQGKEQNYNYNIQGNIFVDEYNISSSVINISALVSSVYIDNNLFILNNKTSVNVIVLPTSQITTFDLNNTISNNKFIVPNLPQSVDITNYWRGKYFDNYDSRLNSIVRAINILETTDQLPELGRTALEGTLFLCRDTHKMCVYNYNRYSGLDGRLINIPFATNYANVSTILSSLDSYKDVGLTLYITDRKQFVTYNGTTFVRTDGYEYNSTTVRIPSQLSEIEVSNCIYKIIYNFDLNGETLTLPSNCTLDFQGGSFSNGTIIGSSTKLSGNIKLDTTLTFSGTYLVDTVDVDWFYTNRGSNASPYIQAALDFAKLIKASVTFGNKLTSGYVIGTTLDCDVPIIGNNARLSSTTVGILNCKNECSIENLYIDFYPYQGASDVTDNKVIAINIGGETSTYNHYINNVTIDGFYYGIVMTNSWNLRCSNLRIIRTRVGIQAYGKCVNNSIVNANIDCKGTNSVCIAFNDEVDHASSTYLSEGWTISNSILTSAQYGIFGVNMSNTFISNCIIDLCSKNAIKFSLNSLNIRIVDNYLACLANGIDVINFTGQNVLNNEDAGIIISNNTIKSYYSDSGACNGINIGEGTYESIYILGNTISNLGGIGIVSLNGEITHINVSDNRFKINVGGYFYVLKATNKYIANNNAIDNYNNSGIKVANKMIIVADSAPTSNTKTWNAGDICLNSNASVGSIIGWFCATSGSPGTWFPIGTIEQYAGLKKQGTTAERPAMNQNYIGATYYDTTLEKMILWNGTAWTNVDGSALT